jgi:hypothetical protein
MALSLLLHTGLRSAVALGWVKLGAELESTTSGVAKCWARNV